MAKKTEAKTKVVQLVVSATVPAGMSADRAAYIVDRVLDNGYAESQDRDNEGDPDCDDLARIELSQVKVLPRPKGA